MLDAVQLSDTGPNTPTVGFGSHRITPPTTSANRALLAQDLSDYVGLLNVSEFFLPRVMLIREPVKVYSQDVQYCCVKVGHAYRFLGCMVTELIRRAIRESAFDAAAGQPQAETKLM